MRECVYFRDMKGRHLIKPFHPYMIFNDEGGVTATGWEDIPPMIGFSVNDGNRFEKMGRWLEQEELLEAAYGVDLKILEAIKREGGLDQFVRLAGIAAHGKPGELWEELDKLTKGADTMRPFWKGTGRVERFMAKDADDAKRHLRPGEFLLRGSMLAGRHNVKEREEPSLKLDDEQLPPEEDL